MHGARGFTLIELSIVLVIIGLIVGGILVGQEMIKNAEVRAQISQIEKYNSAVNNFRAKFGAIPGDMAVATASQYGFTDGFAVGAGCVGQFGGRDGNGLVDGIVGEPLWEEGGEVLLFWGDLSSPVAGNPLTCSGNGVGNNIALTTQIGSTYLGDYLPLGKIGKENFIYVYETSGYNWYGLSAVTSDGAFVSSNANIPVIQAYNVDAKVDDGLPTTGSVVAVYINGSHTSTSAVNAHATDTTTSCYNTTSNVYSISSLANYGAEGNCALSFRFQ